jgi:nicotinamidase-related amidase
MSGMFEDLHNDLQTPYPQIVDAIKCVRAEGMKAAMITNNWKKPGNSSGLMPLDKSPIYNKNRNNKIIIKQSWWPYCL